MADERIVIDPGAAIGWKETDRPERVGRGFRNKLLADGKDGGPFAIFGIQPEGFVNPAHFHTLPQFQVLLEGTVDFPTHKLTAPAVHYSDRNSPYGPFVVGPGFLIGVFRVGAADQIYMTDREGRKQRMAGRELYGQASDVEWSSVHGSGDVAQKSLIPSNGADSPGASLLKCGPGAEMPLGSTPHGCYEIVIDGSVHAGDSELRSYSMRFTQDDRPPTPLVAGTDGATVLVLTFDGS
jgi:hypothetical protein